MQRYHSACGAALALAFCALAPAVQAAEAGPLLQAVGAPSHLKLSGSERLRYEALEGQFRPGAAPSEDVFSIRTVIGGEYDLGGLRVGGELYDSRVYGAHLGSAVSNNEVDAVELVQAYVAADFKDPFGKGSTATLQAGRFLLNLGSRRLVAADDFRNTTNGFTGARFDAALSDKTTAAVFYALPQIRRPDDQPAILKNQVVLDRESFDFRLWGAVVSHPVAPRTVANLSFFGLDERDAPRRPNRDRRLRTLDAHIIRDAGPSGFGAEAEGAYQFGSISASAAPTARTLDVAAGFVHLRGGYQFAGGWKPRLSLEYDWISGDGTGPKFGRFDTLFGTRGGDFGPSGIYAAIGRANMSTPGVRLEVTPSPRLDGFIVYRGLWLAAKTDAFSTSGLRDPTGASGRFAGQQIETRVRYWLKPRLLRLDLNGVVLFKDGVLARGPTAPRTGDIHYIALALNGFF